jgi:iron-sulfur cluster assembly protein
MARARPKILTLTTKAAERVRSLITRSDGAVAGLRVGVKNGGCAGMEYTLDYAADIGPHDEIINDNGAVILVDPKAILFLLGTQIDYEETALRSGFVFNNPNVTDACGCGESVAIAPAQDFSDSQQQGMKGAS